jgi:hypothetical protein
LGEDLRKGIQRSKCLSVICDGKEVTFLGTGDYLGEVALISKIDNKRTADVKALCTCELFELSREDVHTVIKNYPILEARLQTMAEVFVCVCVELDAGLDECSFSGDEEEDVVIRMLAD